MTNLNPAVAQSDIDPLELALEGVVPSVVLAALALGFAWRFWSKAACSAGSGTAWGAPLALGGGFFASYVGIHGWPPADWYPDMKARLAWLGIAAAIFGLVQAGAQKAWRWPALLFFAAASAWLLAHWRLQDMWPWKATLLWSAGATLVAFGTWEALEVLALRRRGAVLPLAWSLGAGLAAQSFYFAHSESHARLASGIAGALGVAFVVGLRKSGLTLARGGTAVFVVLYGGLALANHLTADLPVNAFALILAAPLMPWLAELPLISERRPRLRVVLTLLSVLAPLAVAAWLTKAANPSFGADEYLKSLGY